MAGSTQRPLTPKQQLFVQEYLVDLNASQAALRAGYSPRTAAFTGAENLKKPKIAQVIGQEKARIAERVQVTQEDVLRGLLNEATLQGKGSSHSARVAAWAQLAKHTGGFAERHEVKSVSVAVNLTEEELRDLAARILNE